MPGALALAWSEMGIESPLHLVFLGAIALVVLGPKRLPELARALGKGIREFRTAFDEAAAPQTGAPPVPAREQTTEQLAGPPIAAQSAAQLAGPQQAGSREAGPQQAAAQQDGAQQDGAQQAADVQPGLAETGPESHS
jgi:TatA/E family protein of Tat protein translocase